MKCKDAVVVYNGQYYKGTLNLSFIGGNGVALSVVKPLTSKEKAKMALNCVADNPEELIKDVGYIGAKMIKGYLTGKPGSATRKSGIIEAYGNAKEEELAVREILNLEFEVVRSIKSSSKSTIINNILTIIYPNRFESLRFNKALEFMI